MYQPRPMSRRQAAFGMWTWVSSMYYIHAYIHACIHVFVSVDMNGCIYARSMYIEMYTSLSLSVMRTGPLALCSFPNRTAGRSCSRGASTLRRMRISGRRGRCSRIPPRPAELLFCLLMKGAYVHIYIHTYVHMRFHADQHIVHMHDLMRTY